MRCTPSPLQRLSNKKPNSFYCTSTILFYKLETGILFPIYKIVYEILLLLLYAPTLQLDLLGLLYYLHTYNYLLFTTLTFGTYLYNFITMLISNFLVTASGASEMTSYLSLV